jgi:ATP-dependent helicase/nuclease subunit B
MRLATIPPGVPFLTTLVSACLDGIQGVKLDRASRDFSQAVIFVPTRRAARALAHAFADALQPQAVLLPRIVPLGDPADIEQEAALLAGDGFGLFGDVPPAIHPLRRRLMLARLVETWRKAEGFRNLAARGDGFSVGESFADSFSLAGDLVRVIDEGVIEGVDWSRLKTLVDGPFDEYFRQTRTFLEIAAEAWPAALERLGQIDESTRRNLLLRAEAERLKRYPPAHPVIAAGSTGTMPATAALLAVIARLPQGVVLLPGLDCAMPDPDWDLISESEAASGQPGHPQGALKRLLGQLGANRSIVAEVGRPLISLATRAAVVNASARPADATDGWGGLRSLLEPRLDLGLADLAVIEAADERQEALAIAVALREVLETPDKTAALVTPDRALADRVAAELRRWGVDADDSAGRPLDRMAPGILSSLALHAVAADCAPLAILALLASPCIDWPGGGIGDALAALELLAFRGVAGRQGLDGLAAALDGAQERAAARHAHPAVKRLPPEALAQAGELLAFVVEALRPLAALRLSEASVADFAVAHQAAVAALAGERIMEGADGKALALLLDTLASEGGGSAAGFADYAAIYDSYARCEIVHLEAPADARIHIWGLIEARLLTADRIVLGGLNEGTWPPAPREDAFLNRAMRTTLGLPLPERRIGQSAHDFAQALGAPEAFIARARTVEGEPKIASRLLRRLDAFLGEARSGGMRRRGDVYIHNAQALDEGLDAPAATRPDPRPDPKLQPLTMSVTDVAKLQRDPYAIYARDVLGLRPLDDIDPPPDASDRGTIIHDALAAFVAETAGNWPEDPLERLLGIGRAAFETFGGDETVRAFWWPVFESAAAWIVADMTSRRAMVAEAYAEKSGRLPIPLGDGETLMLRGRGDLIERFVDGSLCVTDYKTGAAPSGQQVKDGVEPQLTLMAAMAMAGAIDGVAKAPVSQIRYVRLGRESKESSIAFKAAEPPLIETAEKAVRTLAQTMTELRAGKRGYISRRRPLRQGDVGEYDHLARAAEWLASDGDEGEPSQEQS